MSQYEELKTNDNMNENKTDSLVASLKLDDNIVAPDDSNSPKKSKSKSKKSKKKTIKSYDLGPERDLLPKRAQTTNCLTNTAPSNKYNQSVQVHDINEPIITQNQSSPHQLMINPHQHHIDDNKHHREDASNLAFPINPFDHLMPHKDDFGTPNMAWIGEDGLVHTPQGGVYAKTTEAVANFRRELKYDSGWHRTRQRYICLILLIMFLTVCAVVVLLIGREVSIVDVSLKKDTNIWSMDKGCSHSNVSSGCNVTIRAWLDIDINNHNWVPATVNTWNIKYLFYCTSSLDCPYATAGSQVGKGSVDDGGTEINRKNTGTAILNNTEMFKLSACNSFPKPNGTFCEWDRSCNLAGHPSHFMLGMQITAHLSFALQSSTSIDTSVRLGVFCNHTVILCAVNEETRSRSIACT